MTATRTRTYTTLDFANPYLSCSECGCWVTAVLQVDGPWENQPCGHTGEIVSVCPSWSPVDGCCCRRLLGGARSPGHDLPPSEHRAEISRDVTPHSQIVDARCACGHTSTSEDSWPEAERLHAQHVAGLPGLPTGDE